ncbi:Ribosomal RNA small subunit methyltransferase I [invertebrate metagenome]|uniref:Ribosomal RNA small subunit methyltransferase I n=1 Tax=invertebrate metagenome TaxID=1711999 RepID=A0A2H9T7U6_9ZZZZ
MSEQSGVLYIVATPIGNLGDLSQRAIDTLSSVDIVAAEDTRHSRQLLQHFGIEKRMISCHDHNERQQTDKLLALIEAGQSIAMVSDAGTPLISDPGYYLVRQARLRNIKVMAIPGPSAIITALSVGGVATDRFFFEGFLPAKSGGRRKRLEALKNLTSTWVIYESPHRILDCLKDCVTVLGGDRYLVLARELTKTFETVISGSAGEVLQRLLADVDQQRGEFVVLVEGIEEQDAEEISEQVVNMLELLIQEMPVKRAVDMIVSVFGCRKKLLYNKALLIKENKE